MSGAGAVVADGERRSTMRAVLLALVGYTALVAWLTWPLAAHLGSRLPATTFICDFDLRQMIWALSWTSHTLVTAPGRVFEANIYHPTPHALLYADAGFGALPYFFPTYVLTGNPVLASNVMFLGSLVVTAWALHLVVARWTGLAAAGFVAAGVLLTTRWTLWTWVPAAPNYGVLAAMPAILVLVARPRLSRAQTGLLAALLALQGAANPYYAVAVLVPVGVLACLRLLSAAGRRTAFRLLVAATLAGVALVALYAPYAWIRSREPALASQTWWGFVRYVTPKMPEGLFLHANHPTSVPVPFLLVIGLGVLVRCWPRGDRTDGERAAWRQGWLWALLGLFLSLPPTIRVLDRTVRLPQAALVDRWAGFDMLRDPHRMGMAALFGLAILAGVAFAECVRALERLGRPARPAWPRALAAGTLVAVASGIWVAPEALRVSPWPDEYPLSPATVSDSPIQAALREPGGPVLELPADPDAPMDQKLRWHAFAMFASIGHWRPLLNGYGGFFPAALPDRMRLAARLPDPAALADLRRETGVELIVVRAGARTPESLARWDELARRGGGDGLRLVARDGADLLFAVEDAGDQAR